MTFGALWAFLAVALPVLGSLVATISAVDLAYHVRAGDMLLATGRIPTTDTFTFTVEGEPWFNQQWAAQALFAAVHGLDGWAGLAILRAALVGMLFGLVYAACRRQGLSPRAAALLTLGAFALSSPALQLRPQLLGMVLFGVSLLVVVERRRRPWLVWLIPALAVPWANVHGSFVLAPLVLGLAWLADVRERAPRAQRTLAAAGASVLTACLTPYGPAVWAYAAGLSTNASVRARLAEWQPPSPTDPVGLAFFVSALAVALFLVARRRDVPWPALAWFGAFAALGVVAVRGIAWWPPAAAVGVAGLAGSGFLGSGEPRAALSRRTRRPVNAVLAAVLVLAGVLLLPTWRTLDPATGAPAGLVTDAPPGVTDALRSVVRPGDRIYAPQPWGSWLEHAVPEATVAIDSRFELFPETVWSDYDAVAFARQGWTDRLEAWGVTIVATDGRHAALVEGLRADAAWRQVYAGPDGVVVVRAERVA